MKTILTIIGTIALLAMIGSLFGKKEKPKPTYTAIAAIDYPEQRIKLRCVVFDSEDTAQLVRIGKEVLSPRNNTSCCFFFKNKEQMPVLDSLLSWGQREMTFSDETLNSLKLVTSTIAPILTFILAILGAFTEKKKDKEFKNGELTYTKKVLTPYGKTILTLLICSALLTLSGLRVDVLIKDHKAQSQKKLDAINDAKRDSILNTAKLTLDTVVTALKTTKEIQVAAERMTATLSNQTERIKKLSVPLFPMKLAFTYERTCYSNEAGLWGDNFITFQEIVDAINSDLGPHDEIRKEPYSLTVKYRDNPYAILVRTTSYNDSKLQNSNLQKLNYLVYKKFAPPFIELGFYRKIDNLNTKDNQALKVRTYKEPPVNTDVEYSYDITVFPNDRLEVRLKIEVPSPNHIYDLKKTLSWFDFESGTLSIATTSEGQVKSLSILTGPQFSYSMTFDIKESDRMGKEKAIKKIYLNE